MVEVSGRPAWRTSQGGHIVTDAPLVRLWRALDGRTSTSSPVGDDPPEVVRAAGACLAEAGLLERDPAVERPRRRAVASHGPPVSVVLVTYQSGDWIDECLASLRRQTYDNLELVVVDNGSPDDPAEAVRRGDPQARYVRLRPGGSFAGALNAGAALATGEYLFFLNPDVALEPDAVAQLVAAAQAHPDWGAVAAKLRFYWAPAFLNGIGNRVEATSWGTDNAIGHLDLGQFDGVTEVPSACFAAALIRRTAWELVGPVDTGFPMYYEDVEWCYRARRFGIPIGLAPAAVVYHAFGSRVATGDEPGLTPRKLAHVVYGRLRFARRVLPAPDRRRYLWSYLREDFGNYRHLRRSGETASLRAYRQGWARALRDWLPLDRQARTLARRMDARRAAAAGGGADASPPAVWPAGLVWNGLPELTLDLVRHHYLPLIQAGQTYALPEWPALRPPERRA